MQIDLFAANPEATPATRMPVEPGPVTVQAALFAPPVTAFRAPGKRAAAAPLDPTLHTHTLDLSGRRAAQKPPAGWSAGDFDPAANQRITYKDWTGELVTASVTEVTDLGVRTERGLTILYRTIEERFDAADQPR